MNKHRQKKLQGRRYSSHLVFQTHEAMPMIISKGGLGGIPSDWITRVPIGKTLNRECWSCKHIESTHTHIEKAFKVEFLIKRRPVLRK